MSRAAVAYDSDAAHSSKSRTSTLRVNKPGDAYEVEADRVAETVSNGGRLGSSHTGWSISKLDMGYVQRDSPDTSASAGVSVVPKPNNYAEGLGKIGEAFLKTDLGKQIADAAQKDPLVKGAESFVDSLPGKIILGAAAAGTVTALAAEHKALPAQLPAIPLDKIKPGLSVKITYQGPVDKPTQATISFSYTPKSATDEKKQKQAASERQHSAWARDAADLRQFQEGLKSPEQKQQEAEDAQHALDAWVTRPGANTLSGGIETGRFLPKAQDKPAGPQLIVPSVVGPQRKPPSLLDKKLELAPIAGPLATADAAKPNADAKKKEEIPVQRRAEPSATIYADSADVEAVIHSSGRPLDPATRRSMESRIGFDFSKVRVHTDARAADSARSLGARAYTVGNHVVFGAGKFAPESSAGRRLIAHELAHVVQQTGPARAAAPARPHLVVQRAPRHVQRDGWLKDAEQFVGDGFQKVKNWVLGKLSKLPGYGLFCQVIGKDLATGAPVQFDKGKFLEEFLELLPGETGKQILARLREAAGAIERGYTWLMQQVAGSGLTVAYFEQLLNRIEAAIDWKHPEDSFDRATAIFREPFDKIVALASTVASKLLDVIVELAIEVVGATGLLEAFRKGRDTIKLVLDDPGAFVGHLKDAVVLGATNFKDHIVDHLENGLVEWLFGEIKVTKPAKFDLAGIMGMALEVLKLTYANIREQFVTAIGDGGELAVRFLEGAFDVVKTLVTGGVQAAGALIWQHVGDLVDTVKSAIRDWVITQLVVNTAQKLLSLFTPASGIIEAVRAIYGVVTFIIDKAKKFKQLIETVTNSISEVAHGEVTPAANKVESTMAQSIPLVLGFFAGLLGISGIAEKIRDTIGKLQAKVTEGIGKVVKFLVSKGRPIWEAGKKAFKEKLSSIKQWWARPRKFSHDGETHTLTLEGDPKHPEVTVHSTEFPLAKYLTDIKAPREKKDQILGLAKTLSWREGDAEVPDQKEVKASEDYDQIVKLMDELELVKDAPPSEVEPQSVNPALKCGLTAKAYLSTKRKIGSDPVYGNEPPIWTGLGSLIDKNSYVRGHLLSNRLGGKGEWPNMVPITNTANQRMAAWVEGSLIRAISALAAGKYKKEKGFRYEVTAKIDDSPISPSITEAETEARLGEVSWQVKPAKFDRKTKKWAEDPDPPKDADFPVVNVKNDSVKLAATKEKKPGA